MLWQNELLAGQRQRRDKHLWRSRSEVTSPQSVRIQRNSKEFLNFSSNDYLGLANDPRLIAASANAAQNWGTGTGASHLVSGHQTPHHLLEQELAEHCGTDSALLFSNGYMANLAIPASFLGRGDLLLQDKLNHASLIDSASLCRAEFKRFPHANYEKAQAILSESGAARKILSTDSVFSMDGDIADLPRLLEVCQANDALLVVDEAHGFGVLGEKGSGAIEYLGLGGNSSILMMGTLGKALGSFGAFIAGSQIYIDELKQKARTYTYTTALPATVVEATRAALKVVKEEPQRREHLRELVRYFREVANQAGLSLMDSESHIQPVLLGSETNALLMSEHLEKQQIWVPAIRPPTVPKGTARLRICFSYNHKLSDIDQLVESLSLFSFEIGNE